MEGEMMFNRILEFMQSEDPNGTWHECSEADKAHILQTLYAWLDDGLVLTPKVQKYIDYLKGDR
jgi:hypothetical protein